MDVLDGAAIIRMGGATNTRCVGCRTAGVSGARGARLVAQDLKEAAAAGVRIAVLVGGEPTLRTDLMALLQVARSLGLGAALATNGRMLVYPDFRHRLLEQSLRYARVEVHAWAPAVHDAMVGVPGAFGQTMQGLTGLLAQAPPQMLVEVACTVTPHNMHGLGALVEALCSIQASCGLGLRLVAPLIGSEDTGLVGSGELADRVVAAVEQALSATPALRVCWEGFAPCLMQSVAEQRDERLRYGVPAFGPEESGESIPRERAGDRVRSLACQECVQGSSCPGAPALLVETEGEQALRPSCAVRANSFNFELVREIGPAQVRAGNCAVPKQAPSGEPARHLVLVRDATAALYRCPTADFDDDEIRHVKDELQQVYVDCNEQGTLTEFVRDVRRVGLHSECAGCPDRAICCGAWVEQAERAFEREERWLRKELSRMRGRVLDVGCGDQLYRDLIAPLIASGAVEYHGLDPDEQALQRLRDSGMGGKLQRCEIEHFEPPIGYFDYVLVLRSVNHFRDVRQAFHVIARALRVHGQLVVCDSPVYALVRTPAQVRYADTHAPVGHEHYRNWTSHQLLECVRALPLRVDVHRPVTVQTCNEWIVKLMRVAADRGSAPA